ncbi:type II secretion system F family protein [Mycolicibacterium sp. 3033]|nr:type II secretion system F family protein [Mycolicibacterium aurantiacum]
MSVAALTLALAVLVAPGSARRRVRALLPRSARAARTVPLIPVVGGGCAALLAVLPVSVVAALAVVAATLLARRRSALRRGRRSGEGDNLHDALDVLVGELRVGAHPVAAVATAAAESQGTVSRSLSAVAARALLGADVAAGLRVEASRTHSPEHWERLAVCWQLAHDHGLAIATVMQTAQHDLAERRRFGRRVEAGLAGARATAAILAGLPLLGLLLGQALGADPVAFLLSGGAGGWLLLIGATLICAGLLWSDTIIAGVVT